MLNTPRPILCITVVRDDDDNLASVVDFGNGERIFASAATLDLGLDEPHTVLHDAAHTLLAVVLGLDGSPVLRRVAGLQPLSQRQVDLEEAAVFAIHAWVSGLQTDLAELEAHQ